MYILIVAVGIFRVLAASVSLDQVQLAEGTPKYASGLD
jgi:hypothetical protein